MKNPILMKKHGELEALQRESDALLAMDEHTEEQEKRVEALPGLIEAKESEIRNIQALAAKNGGSKTFLDGFGGGATHARSEEDDVREIRVGRARVKYFLDAKGNPDPQGAYRFGMFGLAVLLKRPGAIKFCEKNNIQMSWQDPQSAGHQESINEDGGFLVPEEFDTTMIRIIERYGVFRSNARYTPMARETFSRPRRTGGVTAYWVDEGDTATESDADWDRVRMTAKKLMVNTRVSSEVNADAIANFGEMLMFEIAYAFAKKEDQAGFVGDGTSTYGRIKGVTQRLLDVWGTGGGTGLILGSGNAYSELLLSDFNGVKAALPDLADGLTAAWYCHRFFFYDVMEKLAMAAGGVTMAEIAQGGPPRFMGYPVIFANAMPKTAANSQVPIFLGDLAMAADFGERLGVTIAMSEHALFQSDNIAVRGTERVDINVHDVGDATASLAGPVVGLVMAAS